MINQTTLAVLIEAQMIVSDNSDATIKQAIEDAGANEPYRAVAEAVWMLKDAECPNANDGTLDPTIIQLGRIRHINMAISKCLDEIQHSY